jgi:hypothetical protein
MKRPSLRSRQKLSVKARVLVFSASLLVVVTSLIYIVNTVSSSRSMAAAGFHGPKTVTSSNVILNEYTTLTTDANAGTTSISVSSSSLNANGRFPANMAAGELVMIIQMQGASVTTSNNSNYGTVSSYNNCGYYEFAEVQAVPSATTITLTTGLKRSYTSAGHVQVIRVPRYSTFTVNNGYSVTCPGWNGATGGIIAIESNGATTINGVIDANGKGFHGGTVEQNTSTPGDHSGYRSSNATDGAEKGEGIGGLATALSNGEFGRGPNANGGGGGNSHNGGGGGGANAGTGTWNGGGIPDASTASWTTAWNLEGGSFATNNSPGGGRGGYSWSASYGDPISNGPNNAVWSGDSRYNVGGLGGRVLDYSTGRIFMGGGGGAGDSNNGVGTPGGTGGGIVFLISAGVVSGSGVINANGSSVALSSGSPGDASGGGGGGGAIIIYTSGAQIKNITLNAKGGVGGSQTLNNGAEVEGPGGGGSGGYIGTTNNYSLTRNVNGGVNGQTDAPAMSTFVHNGATKGASGLVAVGITSPYSGVTTLPVELISFQGQQSGDYILLTWSTASEKNNDYFTVEKSSDGMNYIPAGKVRGAGTSHATKNYHFLDIHPSPLHNYYRLLQTDYNGTIETFSSIHVPFNGAAVSTEIKSVYPNPFNDKISISFFSDSKEPVRFLMLNSEGQEVRSMVVQADAGVTTVEWRNLNSIPSGSYSVIMKCGKENVAARSVIKAAY